MKQESLKELRCPSCHGELKYESLPENVGQEINVEGGLLRGRLVCSQCSETISIRNGIPRFVSDSGYTESFVFQWNLHRKAQLDSFSGLPISKSRLFSVSEWSENLSGQTILECGSGAGRFTEVLLQTGAQVYSFDYSDAVDANYKNNGAHPNLTLFQASIYDIPLPQASFDKVICLGVIQHTPDPEQSFKCLSEMVRSGGELVIDVYANTLAARLQWYYFLRPLTRRMDKARLYKIISKWTPRLIPLARFFRAIAGRAGARLVPIVEFSYLGMSPELNREWAILDTFDQYSPAHDHPQTEATVQRWFESAGFTAIKVRRGPNGVVGKGIKIGRAF